MRTNTFGGVAAASLSPMRKNFATLNDRVDIDWKTKSASNS